MKFIKYLIFVFVFITFVFCDYITYVKMKDNKLEPVLEAVSSTIEPIPMYRLASKMHSNFDDEEEYDKNTLLTVTNTHNKERKLKYRNQEKHFVKVEPMN